MLNTSQSLKKLGSVTGVILALILGTRSADAQSVLQKIRDAAKQAA